MRKIQKLYMMIALAMATMVVAAGAAFAAVTFDPLTGTGFVGKGDIQLAYGWNNKELQSNLEGKQFQFRSSTSEVTQWTCSKPHPTDPTKETISYKSAETTTQGVGNVVSRVKNQITGFNLNGYTGAPILQTSGDALGSCGGGASGFTYDDNAVTTPGIMVLQVSIDNGVNWVTLS